MKLVARDGEREEEPPEIDLAHDVSFPIAATVAVDREWQQGLLELRREVDRLDRLDALLQVALDAEDDSEV